MGKLKSFKKRMKSSRNSVEKFRPWLSESEKKKLSRDIVSAHFKYKIEPYEFLRFGFDYLSDEGRKTFITNKTRFDYYGLFNDSDYSEILNDKVKTYEMFKEFYGREAIHLKAEGDLKEFEEFVERHTRFIYKPTNAYSGKGVRICDSAEYASGEELGRELQAQGEGICEELIVQPEIVSRFHPESVNTVRVAAYLDGSGQLQVQWCMFRIGSGDSKIDNVSNGGMGAAIDYETGIVIEPAKDYDRNTYIFHPDTGVQIVGYNLPEWDSCRKMLTEIARKIPQVRFVGWDMAYSDKGWVLIEGNSHPMCGAMQITEFKGKKAAFDKLREMYLAENK